jgi:hypothetical protein
MGKPQSEVAVAGITAESLNQHYVAISTDIDYKAPLPKKTAYPNPRDPITE